jgi:hypothetical protein
MEKESIDYNKVADEIPAEWFTETEISDISETMFDNLKNAMNTDIDEAANLVNCTSEDILETLQKAANIYGRMMLFEEKFSDIVAKFPKETDGEINYPDKILAKIFGVNIEEAVDIFQNHFGLGNDDDLSKMVLKPNSII